jgi:hypothetical protein
MPIAVAGIVIPPPILDVTSIDGLIRARVIPAYAGVYLNVDFRSLLTNPAYDWYNPFKGTIYRRDSEGNVVIVRGADQRTQYGGVFSVFDDEVKFGEVYTYWVDGYQRDGTVHSSYTASVRTWAPDGGYDMPGVWFKSLDDISKSQPVRVISWKGGNYEANFAQSKILNSRFAGINTRVRSAFTTSMTILTDGEEEYEAFLDMAASGIVFVVGLSKHRRRTGYYVLGDIAPTRIGETVHSSYDAWTVEMIEQDRPGTQGQNGPVLPWRNLADRLYEYPRFEDSTGSGRTYGDGSEPPE